MFSFVEGVLLSPLPYSEPDRIVRVLERPPTGGLNSVSTLNYLDWTGQNAVFEYLAAEVGWRTTLTGGTSRSRFRARASRRTTSISSERSQHWVARFFPTRTSRAEITWCC